MRHKALEYLDYHIGLVHQIVDIDQAISIVELGQPLSLKLIYCSCKCRNIKWLYYEHALDEVMNHVLINTIE